MSDEQGSVGEVHGGVATDSLRKFIERIQRLESEKSEIANAIKDLYGAAKAEGLDVKIMKKVISILKEGNAKREEFESILDTYLAALGVIDRD
jgi:uncharacterized protein (UPF0335 family)